MRVSAHAVAALTHACSAGDYSVWPYGRASGGIGLVIWYELGDQGPRVIVQGLGNRVFFASCHHTPVSAAISKPRTKDSGCVGD
eukprot:1546618-Rhodomonas_salina.1